MADHQKASKKGDISNLTFEEALEELENIVEQLEGGDVPLDQSIATYERGEKLKRHCAGLLQKAEERIQKIRLGSDGKAEGAEPLDESND